jgi:hypothetical protein
MAGKSYVGKAGHLATMGEFLIRGYNAAMPEVDLGDDIFVVRDRTGRLWRVQVKTAIGLRKGYGFLGQFAINLNQLTTPRAPDLHYVLALRKGTQWEFVILTRSRLLAGYRAHGWGSVVGRNVILKVRFTETDATCSGRSLQRYLNNWAPWPVID